MRLQRRSQGRESPVLREPDACLWTRQFQNGLRWAGPMKRGIKNRCGEYRPACSPVSLASLTRSRGCFVHSVCQIALKKSCQRQAKLTALTKHCIRANNTYRSVEEPFAV